MATYFARRICAPGRRQRGRCKFPLVTAKEIDDYLAGVPHDQRQILERLRATILDVVPEAQQCLSYRVPAFRVPGGIVGGFASFKNHMSYLPFSGSVLSQLNDQIGAYSHTKSALHFTASHPLPDDLIARLIHFRWREIRSRTR